MTRSTHIATTAVRHGLGSDQQHNAVVSPIHLSSTYQFHGFDQKGEYDYSRSGNPTRDDLAGVLSRLEGGVGCVVTSSGMAAINLVCQLLKPDDLLLAPHDCYGGTHRLLSALQDNGRVRVKFVNQSDECALEQAFREQPAMILCETPSNPLLRITDLALVRKFCDTSNTIMAVDNTFLSPGWQNPIALGADLVLHSTTKYLNGHSDVVGGAVIAASEELHERVAWWANCIGATGAPFDSFLCLRGVRTLQPRLRAHEENAQHIVALLCSHDAVKKVYYPGLESHPGHAVASVQQRGFGAMISFELQGTRASVKALLESLALFFLAESLGGVESLVAHPATMTHAAMEPEARAIAGISDNLIRLSVGIEHAADLVADLKQGLDAAHRKTQQATTQVSAQRTLATPVAAVI